MKKDLFPQLKQRLMEQLELGRETGDAEVLEGIDSLLEESGREHRLPVRERERLRKELFCSVRRLDVLQELLEDPEVTEIMVNGYEKIFVERRGRVDRWEKGFTSRDKLEDVIQQIVGSCNRVVNENFPIVDARLDNGARVNAVLPPVALDGAILTIRRFPDQAITTEQLVEWGSISREADRLLEQLVRAGYSILIGGGTSTGKTTFLNALSNYIPKEERLITIEDNAELQIQGVENLVRLEVKTANLEGGREVTVRDLIKTALRMRPDRIVVGEVRGAEALDLLQAWNTGHEGSLGTIHANSCRDMVSRLETMSLMGMQLPLEAVRRQIASGVEILVHLGRRGGRRRVLEIAEITGFCQGEVQMEALYLWDEKEQGLKPAGGLRRSEKLDRLSGLRGEAGASGSPGGREAVYEGLPQL